MSKFVFTALLSLLFLSQCSLPDPNDIVPPVAAIVYPYEGAVIASNFTALVEASDNNSVSAVRIYLDGVEIAAVSKAPYEKDISIASLEKDISHVLQAVAQDKDGNKSFTGLVRFTVSDDEDNVDPVVSLMNPQDGQVVEQDVQILAEASDDRAVQKVEFYIDGALESTDTTEPYQYSWNTVGLSDSTEHSIFAKAWDVAGNTALSDIVTVTLFQQSVDNVAPVATILYPVAGSTITGTVAVAVDARDNVAVTKVEFYVDGVLTNTDTAAAWGFAWNTAALSKNQQHTLYVKAFDAAGNVGVTPLLVVTVQ